MYARYTYVIKFGITRYRVDLGRVQTQLVKLEHKKHYYKFLELGSHKNASYVKKSLMYLKGCPGNP